MSLLTATTRPWGIVLCLWLLVVAWTTTTGVVIVQGEPQEPMVTAAWPWFATHDNDDDSFSRHAFFCGNRHVPPTPSPTPDPGPLCSDCFCCGPGDFSCNLIGIDPNETCFELSQSFTLEKDTTVQNIYCTTILPFTESFNFSFQFEFPLPFVATEIVFLIQSNFGSVFPSPLNTTEFNDYVGMGLLLMDLDYNTTHLTAWVNSTTTPLFQVETPPGFTTFFGTSGNFGIGFQLPDDGNHHNPQTICLQE